MKCLVRVIYDVFRPCCHIVEETNGSGRTAVFAFEMDADGQNLTAEGLTGF